MKKIKKTKSLYESSVASGSSEVGESSKNYSSVDHNQMNRK